MQHSNVQAILHICGYKCKIGLANTLELVLSARILGSWTPNCLGLLLKSPATFPRLGHGWDKTHTFKSGSNCRCLRSGMSKRKVHLHEQLICGKLRHGSCCDLTVCVYRADMH